MVSTQEATDRARVHAALHSTAAAQRREEDRREEAEGEQRKALAALRGSLGALNGTATRRFAALERSSEFVAAAVFVNGGERDASAVLTGRG